MATSLLGQVFQLSHQWVGCEGDTCSLRHEDDSIPELGNPIEIENDRVDIESADLLDRLDLAQWDGDLP